MEIREFTILRIFIKKFYMSFLIDRQEILKVYLKDFLLMSVVAMNRFNLD